MIVLESQLAKKYAVAFLNVHAEDCFPEHEAGLIKFEQFVSTQKIFQATLSLPSLSLEKKEEIINQVAQKLQLPPCIERLPLILLKHKRLDLLNSILKKIMLLYKQREKQHHFHVSTSHELATEEKEAVIKFIKTFVKNNVATSFDIDKMLISGIRIKGTKFLWERSIAKQLRDIERTILRREELL